MSKLPSGMVKRGRCYITRIRKGTTPDGMRIDRWVNLGKDREAAEAEFHRVRAGDRPPVERLTVSGAAQRWLVNYVSTRRSPKNQRDAATRVRLYLEPFMGTRQLERVSGEHVREYLRWLEGKELAPQTVTHILSDCRCFFSWCVADAGLLDRSPFPRRIMPRIQERPPDRLSTEDAEALNALPEPWAFVIRLGLGTGLRWGEMVRLQRLDLVGDELVIHHTKSGKVRRVPVPPPLLREIWPKVGRLVGYAEGSVGTFNRRVRKLAGLERFHVHQLRHEFACQWLERTGDLIALQQVLGHASIETTQRYAELSAAHVRAAAKRFAEGGRRDG